MFFDDNPAGETLISGRDLKGTFPTVQAVLLDEVCIVYSHNLKSTSNFGIYFMEFYLVTVSTINAHFMMSDHCGHGNTNNNL